MVYLYNVILLAGESNMDGCKNNFNFEGKKPEKKAYVSYNYNIRSREFFYLTSNFVVVSKSCVSNFTCNSVTGNLITVLPVFIQSFIH